MAVNLNPQAWAVPVLAIATPPDPMHIEINNFRTDLLLMSQRLQNMATFLGLIQNLMIPNVPVGPVATTNGQDVLNLSGAALELYRTSLVNAQNLLLLMTQQAVQPAPAPPPPPPPAPVAQPMIKVTQPEYDGTPSEKAQGFMTACQTYCSLHPGDFTNDKIFITWALACISDESKATSWKAHWLTIHTQNISTGNPQPLILMVWDKFVTEFLGKFLNPAEAHCMQQ